MKTRIHASAVLVLVAAAAAGVAACDESALPDPSQVKPVRPTTAAATATAPATAAPTATAKPLPPMPVAPPLPPTPAGLPELKTPADNPLTPEKVMLGKQLFFDTRLSKDGKMSCETCHVPEQGWTDGKAVSTKFDGKDNTRHSPTLYNVGYNELWYWDGRAETLEKQVQAAWEKQMGAEPAAIAAALAKIPGYEVQFKTIFGGDPTADSIVKSLASFVRTIRSGGSPWDRREGGEKDAVSADAEKGFEVFRKKGGCAACHAPPSYTDNGFHNTGIGFDKKEPDPGRGKTANDKKLHGAFKTPMLRSVGTHPPYFHDGRAATLEEAIDFMANGGMKEKNPNLDEKLKKSKLNKKEKEHLMAFLKALEAPPMTFERPTLPQAE